MNFESYNQNLQKHLWKDRVLIIESENAQNELYQQQIKALKNDTKGLKERKLVIYSYFNDGYKTGFSEIIKPFKIKVKRKGKTYFSVALIGLDGGKKLQQKSILTKEKLFAIIDGMPMRRRELKKNEDK
jgi:hypothetical protein